MKKLAANGWLKFKREKKENMSFSYRTSPLLPINKIYSYASMTKFGQLNHTFNEDGVARRVESDPDLEILNEINEGQFENGLLDGWGRQILSDGSYHIGWFKGGIAHGYGIGNRFSGG